MDNLAIIRLLCFLNLYAVYVVNLDNSVPQDDPISSSYLTNLLDSDPPLSNVKIISEQDVQFWLYTRLNPHKYQILKINDTESLYDSDFDFNKKVKLVVHGWITNGTSFVPDVVKNAYLNKTDINVIILDWSNVANSKYIFASYYVNNIGGLLTEFLKFLVDHGVSTNDIHLIGHSLGAHVVGIAGYYYYEQRKPINAITGLDPAYPLYKYTGDEWRLDKSDARHVEVIHTCGGYLGFPGPLGHIDFYPNGGTSQPGCGLDLIGICAHERAVSYFAESIVSDIPFTAVKCKDYDELYYNGYCNSNDTISMSGLDLNYSMEGVYYLKTASDFPFALGDPSNWNNNTSLCRKSDYHKNKIIKQS